MSTTFNGKDLSECITKPEDLRLWMAVGCAACKSFDVEEGCQDPHGLCLSFGQLHCKWQKKSREAFIRFIDKCDFSALQNELLRLYSL